MHEQDRQIRAVVLGTCPCCLSLHPRQHIFLTLLSGDFLVEKRKQAGMIQAEVAKKLHRYQSFVATVEGGQKKAVESNSPATVCLDAVLRGWHMRNFLMGVVMNGKSWLIILGAAVATVVFSDQAFAQCQGNACGDPIVEQHDGCVILVNRIQIEQSKSYRMQSRPLFTMCMLILG